MKKTILGLFILLAATILANAQRINYLNYRATPIPHTSSFSGMGEVKLSLLRQTYLPNIGWTSGGDFGYRTKVALTSLLGNYLLVNDNQLGVSYSLTTNISLIGSYLHSKRNEIFVVESEGSNIPYKGNTNAFYLGGAYRGTITPNLQWEQGTSLTIGDGKFNFEESITYELQYEKSYLKYSTFSHNFLASISYRYRKLDLTAQLNAGYLRHFKLNYTPALPYAYDKIVQQFYAHQTDYYVDPALLVNINFSRLGIQLHGGYPYSFGERKLSKPMLTLGIGISYRFTKGPWGIDKTEP